MNTPILQSAQVDTMLARAIGLHRAGQREQARALYQQLLSDVPGHLGVLHFLGLLTFQEGRSDVGMVLVERALDAAPADAAAHANLANMRISAGRLDDAELHLERALELDPEAVPPRVALSILRREQGRIPEAEALAREAVELDPSGAAGHHTLARVLIADRRIEEGLKHCYQAICLRPTGSESNRLYGYALAELGRLDEAAEHYRRWSLVDPVNPIPRFMQAACSGKDVPLRADDAFVKTMFDNFARDFDAKLAGLCYQAPALVIAAIEACLPVPAGALAVLDAGCGTGLLGAGLKPYCARLDGVDLSTGMLQQARQRGIYDRLFEQELTAFLTVHPSRYNLVVCADTLCYFGDLQAVTWRTYDALIGQGWFVFTLEHATDLGSGYRLNHHGRYSHSEVYAMDVLRARGFTVLGVERQALRMESGKPVAGLVIAAQKLSAIP